MASERRLRKKFSSEETTESLGNQIQSRPFAAQLKTQALTPRGTENSAESRQFARKDGEALVQKKQLNAAVIQKKDKYYPDTKEPHIHEHKGGVTFTDIGHNHKYLQRGDKVYQNVINEVVGSLRQAGDDRSVQIANWIEANVAEAS